MHLVSPFHGFCLEYGEHTFRYCDSPPANQEFSSEWMIYLDKTIILILT